MEHPPASSAPEDSARKFRLALAAVATPEDGEWATADVVEAAGDKQRAALEALCVAATRAASSLRGGQ